MRTIYYHNTERRNWTRTNNEHQNVKFHVCSLPARESCSSFGQHLTKFKGWFERNDKGFFIFSYKGHFKVTLIKVSSFFSYSYRLVNTQHYDNTLHENMNWIVVQKLWKLVLSPQTETVFPTYSFIINNLKLDVH